MLKLIVILLIAAIGVGYYMGFFTADDNPKKMIKKVEDLAKEKIEDTKDSVKETISDTVKAGIVKAKEAVDDK